MMPGMGVIRGVPNQRNLEEQIERQMGCMTGFLQIFDRNQILAGKRFYSTKRLPSSLVARSTSLSEKSDNSTISMIKEELEFPFSPSPENHLPTNIPGRHTIPLPVFEIKDGLKASWKLREAPRLSLDSRANVDAKGKLRSREIQTTPVVFSGNLSEASEDRENQEKQRRSPSVVARLMGLEELPGEEPPKRPELRRSASESHVTRDLSQFNFQKPSPIPSEEVFGLQKQDYSPTRYRDSKPEAPLQTPGSFQRKSFFDAQEFFPEPKRVGSLYGEIEKRLRLRGIEEPARDLETLKQILEALQLKGLLHCKQPEQKDSARLNVFHDRRPRSSAAVQSPIVVMKPLPKRPPRLAGSEPPTFPSRSMPPRRLPVSESIPPARIRRDRLEIDRNLRSTGRQSPRLPEPSLASRNPSDPSTRRRPRNVEGQRAPLPQRRIPAVHSPKPSSSILGSGQVGLPKNRRRTTDIPPTEVYSTAEDDTSTSLSDMSIISSASQLELERARNEDYRSGRSLLERCDKLLHSIAAITSSAEQVISTDRQPSPVSVLDPAFLSDESFASSLPKRAIDFNDWNEDHWNHQPTLTTGSNSSAGSHEQETTLDKYQHEDYAFVADVLRESDLHRNADDAFALIEDRHHTANSSTLHRRLVFDTVTELVNRKCQLSPWDNFSGAVAACDATSLMRDVWEELCRIQEWIPAEDAMKATCSVIRKDMAAGSDREQGWRVPGVEMSEAVLHIERQVFKDIVADTIRELADLPSSCRRTAAISRRKLVF